MQLGSSGDSATNGESPHGRHGSKPRTRSTDVIAGVSVLRPSAATAPSDAAQTSTMAPITGNCGGGMRYDGSWLGANGHATTAATVRMLRFHPQPIGYGNEWLQQGPTKQGPTNSGDESGE